MEAGTQRRYSSAAKRWNKALVARCYRSAVFPHLLRLSKLTDSLMHGLGPSNCTAAPAHTEPLRMVGWSQEVQEPSGASRCRLESRCS